jgi:hypothetical protein
MRGIAIKKDRNRKKYTSTVLLEAIERNKFLRSSIPSLSKVGYEDKTFFLFRIQSSARLITTERSLFETAAFNVLYLIRSTVSIFTI